MITSKIKIEGTHCASCKALIEDVCSDMPGVSFCEVNHQSGETVIEHDEDMDMDKLVEQIEALGSYKVKF